jgi:hypothetical protein
MEQVERLERFPQPEAGPRPEPEIIDLRFDVPVIDLRSEPIDLDFGTDAEPRDLRNDDVVIDLRDDNGPVVVVGDDTPMSLFGNEARRHLAEDDPPDALSLSTVGMWSRPDRCLPMLVNLARYRQGGVAAVSAERTDLTELAALASRRGDVDARRLVRLARSCR